MFVLSNLLLIHVLTFWTHNSYHLLLEVEEKNG